MPYSPTTWVAKVTEVTAGLMNKIETGIGTAQTTAESAQSSASAAQTSANNAVQPSRQVLTGTGLAGGGDLSADRTHSVSFGTTSTTVASGDRGVPTGGTTGQSLVKNSNTNYDLTWTTITGGGGGGNTLQDEGTTLGTQRVVWNIVGEGIDATDDAANTRSQIRARGTVARATSAPSSPQSNQLWVDTSSVSQGIPKQYDGSAWQSLLQWTGLSGTPSTFAPSAHATNHDVGGSDAVKRYDTIDFFFSGAVTARSTGRKRVRVGGTIVAVSIVADTPSTSGSVTVDLQKATSAAYGTMSSLYPTNPTNKPTLAANGYDQNSTLPDTLSLSAGDHLRANCTAAGTGAQNVTVSITWQY